MARDADGSTAHHWITDDWHIAAAIGTPCLFFAVLLFIWLLLC